MRPDFVIGETLMIVNEYQPIPDYVFPASPPPEAGSGAGDSSDRQVGPAIGEPRICWFRGGRLAGAISGDTTCQ